MQAERDIRARIGGQALDFAAMAAVSNIYRAANVIRNRLERQILAGEDLSWAAFTVLFVLWIWGDQQTRHLADEAGVTKGTLTGVLKTLEKRGLTRRRAHEADGRLVLVSLEPKGVAVIERLFPAFNMGEASVSSGLTEQEKHQLARLLRKIIRSVEGSGRADDGGWLTQEPADVEEVMGQLVRGPAADPLHRSGLGQWPRVDAGPLPARIV
jgi:MarR family transcriptional regulator, organic hydroperoxide resistance regulator